MTPNTREALRLLGAYTANRYTIYDLAGSQRATCRRHILSALLGCKVNVSDSGVTRLRLELYGVAAPAMVGATCEAHREAMFVEWAKAVTR